MASPPQAREFEARVLADDIGMDAREAAVNAKALAAARRRLAAASDEGRG
jgi:hypothetical protein